jgi:intein/homing endonuclease
MNRDKELKLLKMIDRIAEEIQMVGQTLDEIEGVTICARNSKLEFLRIGHLLKLDNEKKAQEQKEKEQEKKEEDNPSWRKENSTT